MRRHFSVIASAAKQSMSRHKERMDCFAALAMTWIEPQLTGHRACPGVTPFSHGAGSLHWTRHEDAELHKNNRRQYLGN
jgi:hypothetical protein